jgi:hypothetical protein
MFLIKNKIRISLLQYNDFKVKMILIAPSI